MTRHKKVAGADPLQGNRTRRRASKTHDRILTPATASSHHTYRPLTFEESIAGHEDSPLSLIVVSTWRAWRHWIRFMPSSERLRVTLSALALLATLYLASLLAVI